MSEGLEKKEILTDGEVRDIGERLKKVVSAGLMSRLDLVNRHHELTKTGKLSETFLAELKQLEEQIPDSDTIEKDKNSDNQPKESVSFPGRVETLKIEAVSGDVPLGDEDEFTESAEEETEVVTSDTTRDLNALGDLLNRNGFVPQEKPVEEPTIPEDDRDSIGVDPINNVVSKNENIATAEGGEMMTEEVVAEDFEAYDGLAIFERAETSIGRLELGNALENDFVAPVLRKGAELGFATLGEYAESNRQVKRFRKSVKEIRKILNYGAANDLNEQMKQSLTKLFIEINVLAEVIESNGALGTIENQHQSTETGSFAKNSKAVEMSQGETGSQRGDEKPTYERVIDMTDEEAVKVLHERVEASNDADLKLIYNKDVAGFFTDERDNGDYKLTFEPLKKAIREVVHKDIPENARFKIGGGIYHQKVETLVSNYFDLRREKVGLNKRANQNEENKQAMIDMEQKMQTAKESIMSNMLLALMEAVKKQPRVRMVSEGNLVKENDLGHKNGTSGEAKSVTEKKPLVDISKKKYRSDPEQYSNRKNDPLWELGKLLGKA